MHARGDRARGFRGRSLKKLAWDEYRISRQCDGQWQMAAAVEIEGWFVREHLGYGLGEGPSLDWTLRNLAEINRRNRASLERRAVAPSVAKKTRLSPAAQRRRLRSILRCSSGLLAQRAAA